VDRLAAHKLFHVTPAIQKIKAHAIAHIQIATHIRNPIFGLGMEHPSKRQRLSGDHEMKMERRVRHERGDMALHRRQVEVVVTEVAVSVTENVSVDVDSNGVPTATTTFIASPSAAAAAPSSAAATTASPAAPSSPAAAATPSVASPSSAPSAVCHPGAYMPYPLLLVGNFNAAKCRLTLDIF
jgi:hypothetical protein